MPHEDQYLFDALTPNQPDDDGTPITDWDGEIAFQTDDEPPAPAPVSAKLKSEVVKYVLSHRIVTTKQLLDLPEPDWFIDGLIPKSPFLVLHGSPGSRKTFVALDWAVCAQHGLDWHGRKMAPGSVLYVLGEGTTFLGRRLKALAHSKGMRPEDIKVTWMAEPLNLAKVTPEQCALWHAFIEHFDFKYIVFDTLHKNTAGMEENSSKEMGEVFDNARRIAGKSGADVIFVHHDTKAKATTRGSGAIDGDADSVILCKDLGGDCSRLSSDKIRDAEAFDNLDCQFAEDEEAESIYIKTVGAKAVSASKRQLIIKAILAEPGVHTRGDVCCTVGDGGSTQDAYTSLLQDGSIYTEDRPNPKVGRGHTKRIQVLFVDTKVCPIEDLPSGF